MDFRLRDWSLIFGKVLYLFSLHKLALGSSRRPCTEGIDGSVLWGEMTRTCSWPLTSKWRVKMPSSIPLLLIPLRGLVLTKSTAIFELFTKSKPQASSVSTHTMCCVLRRWCETWRYVYLKLLGYLKLQCPRIWRRDVW